MKKVLLSLSLVAFALGAQAQYQLANPGFDGTWSDIQPYTGGSSTKVGTTPSGWCIANVAGYKLLGITWTGKTVVGTADTDRNNASNGHSCKLENKETVGNVIPGYVTLGTSWNTADTSGGNADGGSFGGADFIGTPDAIEFWYKRTASDNSQPASVVAYMWRGSTSQADVPVSIGSSPTKKEMTNRDRTILGLSMEGFKGGDVTYSPDFSLIASLMTDDEHIIRLTEQKSNWTKATYEFTYHNNNEKPTKINVVFGAMDYFANRSNHKKENTLTVDDVKFLYYSELASCTYDGAAVTFTNGTATIDEIYDANKLEITSNGHGATIERSMDEDEQLLTITIKGEDISENMTNYNTYTIQFKKSEPDPSPAIVDSKTYTEDLYVTIAGMTADKQVAGVLVESLDNGNINFILKNFVLMIGEDTMPIGNIAVKNIEGAEDGSFTFNESIQIAEGDDSSITWLGPSVTEDCGGSVPLDMSGQFMGDDKVIVYISIDITNFLGYAVDVHLGYAAATMAVDSEAQYGTFCAPFAVDVPVGVTAYTVPTVVGGSLTLAEVDETIPANTPVILFAENGYMNVIETEDEVVYLPIYLFGVAEEGTPTVGMLTGVYEDTEAPVGSYVLQDNGKVGFYQVVDGQQPTVGANRCYLTVPAGVKAAAFFFDEDDATGIKTIDNAQQTTEGAAIYNLAGQRMSKMQKGINIINGKKILK